MSDSWLLCPGKRGISGFGDGRQFKEQSPQFRVCHGRGGGPKMGGGGRRKRF